MRELPELPFSSGTVYPDGTFYIASERDDDESLPLAFYTAADMRAYARQAVAAAMERAAQIAKACECGDGSHDYNAGAATMQEAIIGAISAEMSKEPQ